MNRRTTKTVRLSESKLKQIITESIMGYLNEADVTKAQAGVRQMKDSVRGKETNTHTNSGLYADGFKQVERFVRQILDEILKACENVGMEGVNNLDIEKHFEKTLTLLNNLKNSKPSKANDVSGLVQELLTYLSKDIIRIAKATRHDGSDLQVDPTIRIKFRKALMEIVDEVEELLQDVDHFDPSDLNTVLRIAKSELSSFAGKAKELGRKVGSKARDLSGRVKRGIGAFRGR